MSQHNPPETQSLGCTPIEQVPDIPEGEPFEAKDLPDN